MAEIISRITTAFINTLSKLLSPFAKKGEEKTGQIIDDVLKGSPEVEGKFHNLYERWIKGPFKGWWDFIANPREFSPTDAVDMSKTFIPGAIGATAAVSSADTLAQMLPFGLDTSGIGIFENKVWTRLGLAAATAATFQSPIRIGLNKNLDYYYNNRFRSQKLALPQAYDGVRYREFLTESEWASFESDIKLPKSIEVMTPEEIADWAAKAAKAVDGVEVTNTQRFMEALSWLGFKEDDILLQDRAAKTAPSSMMLRQMAMRGFFDAEFFARATFKGGFDNWAIKPMLNFYAYMAQEGLWTGYREAAQSAFTKGLIDEDELRSILKRIHVPELLIEPIIETQKLKIGHKDRDLTTTQLLSAYSKGVLTREEILTELKGLGYSETLAETLVKTKESSIKPAVRMPTLSQFSRAFREGIITEEDFRANLDKRGYEQQYIDLIIDVEKAKFPVVKPKMTMSNLGRAYREGLISETLLKQRLGELGYSVEEANLIKEIYLSQNKIPTASLSKAEVLNALKANIIDMYEATERLISMGYPLEDIEILYKLKLGGVK